MSARVTPVRGPRPAARPKDYLRALATVRAIDLAEALGAERLAALLHERAPAGRQAWPWIRTTLLILAILAAGGAAAALLLHP